MPRKGRRYNLYSKCDAGREPMISVKTESGIKKGCRYGYRRGALLRTFGSYAELKECVKSFAIILGISQRRAWDDLFDWGEG